MTIVSSLSNRIVSLAYRATSRFKERYLIRLNILEKIADKISGGDPTWIEFRDTHFAPLANALIMARLTPNIVSFLGVAFACFAAFVPDHVVLFTILIFFNLVCDGIDGVMARKIGSDSDVGSIIDVCCDTLSVIAVAIGLIIAGKMELFIGLSYIIVVVLYTTRSAVKNKLLRKTFLSVGSRIMAFSGLILIVPISLIINDDNNKIGAINYLFVSMIIMLLTAYFCDVIKTRK